MSRSISESALARMSEGVRRLNPGLFKLQGASDPFKDVAKKRKPSGPIAVKGESKLETRFRLIWESIGGPPLERELVFHPSRMFRADFAHLGSKTLIEVEGGIYSRQSGHSSFRGMTRDFDKYLLAFLGGWNVVRLWSQQINRDTLVALAGTLRRMETNRRMPE